MENEQRSSQEIPEKANIYRYYDNRSNNVDINGRGPLIFECKADSIAAADRMLLEATGRKADKEGAIGCTIYKAK